MTTTNEKWYCDRCRSKRQGWNTGARCDCGGLWWRVVPQTPGPVPYAPNPATMPDPMHPWRDIETPGPMVEPTWRAASTDPSELYRLPGSQVNMDAVRAAWAATTATTPTTTLVNVDDIMAKITALEKRVAALELEVGAVKGELT